MKPLLALNWKLQKGPREAAEWSKALLEKLPANATADLAIMAPAISLQSLSNALTGSSVTWGGQDVSAEAKGAFTGETSAAMLTEVGCKYAVIGHSERREYHSETDATVNRKAKAAIAAGLIPIICVGEKLDVREAGNAEAHTLGQLEVALDGIELTGPDSFVIAYEPIWAIGTGKTATPLDAEAMGKEMRAFLEHKYGIGRASVVKLLYGGSVKPDNIKALMSAKDVDGALVGGASLEIDSVLGMLAGLN
jgi:triosephosphate isomerase (TIM)